MKKTQFIILASCCLSFAGIAQNRGIKFNENQPWQEVVEKARQAGKYIFMDCYTVWCGPCKLLDKNVFSNDEIADYYNDGFINAKYNMEKGEGVSLKEKYRVTAYPTLLFIDAKTEEIVHRVVGAGDVKHMLAQAKIAKESSQNLQSLKKQYETGEKNAET
ncbi:MAG: thioredoxin family protein, partial [Odoribacteraceae bacterium]|nr:thioredoxin family protein [Odoribacteraceae bacterium]